MKILIVDDRRTNIEAARVAAKEFAGEHTFEYALSEIEATRAIHMAFESGEPFDLVISDLEMERSESGLVVAEEAFACLAMPYIATGKPATDGSHGHGPSTTIRPLGRTLGGTKDDSKIWQQVLEIVLGDYAQSQTVSALSRYRRFVGRRLDDRLIQTYRSMFKS